MQSYQHIVSPLIALENILFDDFFIPFLIYLLLEENKIVVIISFIP